MKFILAIFILTISSSSIAQDIKREFEKSIKPHQAPDRVRVFMDFFFPNEDKLKYFHESDGENEFYEVKLKWNNRPISVEFYKNAKLMDIEELVEIESLPENPQQKIKAYFEQNFERYHLHRTQVQYSGSAAIKVIESLKANDFSDIILRYEIEAEVAGNEDSTFGNHEFLFDAEGNFIKMRPILKRSSDNVTY